jgi:8-oxo-dGTP diphosphatase
VPTEFSLVVLLSPNSRQRQKSNISVLLGKKLRGFGKGFYNCFGGKLEKSNDEHQYPSRGAVREVQEETGMHIPVELMEDGLVGTLNFTFDDWEVNKSMKVYLYCIVVSLSSECENNTLNPGGAIVIDPESIRGCDEIEPAWFDNIFDIPLQQMFADDSLWLTMLLSYYNQVFESRKSSTAQHPDKRKLKFDAWFHFEAGGAESNQIMHHHIQMNRSNEAITLCSASPPMPSEVKFTLEQRLFHALHSNHIHSPSIKEFKENYAMVNAVRRHMGEEERIQYVIDVAGGHGALGKCINACNDITEAIISYVYSCSRIVPSLDKEMSQCNCD